MSSGVEITVDGKTKGPHAGCYGVSRYVSGEDVGCAWFERVCGVSKNKKGTVTRIRPGAGLHLCGFGSNAFQGCYYSCSRKDAWPYEQSLAVRSM